MNIEQQIDRINNVRKQLELLEAGLNELREQSKQQPEFGYPIYMQSKQYKTVVKFTDLTSGEAVVSENCDHPIYAIGYVANNWIPHTNSNNWRPIAFDEKCGIADKQLCECWADRYTHNRVLRFYDAVNKCVFSVEGKRNGIIYDKYYPIPYADYPDWAIEAEKTLED
jgi:hypothetical protein